MQRSQLHFAKYHQISHCLLDHLDHQEKIVGKAIATKSVVPNSLKGSSPISNSGEDTVSTRDSEASVGFFTEEERKLYVFFFYPVIFKLEVI